MSEYNIIDRTLTDKLLAGIRDRARTRIGVARDYAYALKHARDSTDFAAVNAEIVARWSVSALEWIKREAWRIAYPSQSTKKPKSA